MRALCNKRSKTDKYHLISLGWNLEKKKKPKLIDTDWWLPKAGVGEIGKNCLKLQTSSYKINELQGVMYSIVTIVSTAIL